jgi:hypothetical protein
MKHVPSAVALDTQWTLLRADANQSMPLPATCPATPAMLNHHKSRTCPAIDFPFIDHHPPHHLLALGPERAPVDAEVSNAGMLEAVSDGERDALNDLYLPVCQLPTALRCHSHLRTE